MVYFVIIITPLLNFILFEVFFFKANLFYAVILISDLLLLLAVRIITGKKIISRDFWNFSIFPILFSSSLAAYSLLAVNHTLIHLLFVLNLFFTYFYLKNIYRGAQRDFLENISAYGNLLTVFFCFSVIYGLESFLGLPIWLLILCSGAAMILIIYQILWANKIQAENMLAYAFLAGLLLVELAWAVYFLPFNYNALGLIAVICYYLLISFVKLSLAEKLTGRSVKLYLASGFIFLLLIFLSARWA
ncbi:MAG: hypothetical protein PHO56_02480 [Patescibacteria group bacterium]|nr:hypothetical protein [Patescibacteria group bacterium]